MWADWVFVRSCKIEFGFSSKALHGMECGKSHLETQCKES